MTAFRRFRRVLVAVTVLGNLLLIVIVEGMR
jgi:hypothetical protein